MFLRPCRISATLFSVPVMSVLLSLLCAMPSPRLLAQTQQPQGTEREKEKAAQDKFEEESEGKEKDFIVKRMQWFHDQRAYPHATLPPKVREAAIQERDLKVAREAALRQSLGASLSSQTATTEPAWKLIGPQPIGTSFPDAGRVTSLVMDPANPKTLYMGGAEGGVWKTTDGGQVWKSMTDSQPSLAVGAITLDPTNPNTIYVGTGEQNFSGDSYYGAGILKSTDAGATWTQYQYASAATGGPCGGEYVGAIAVHPTNNQIVLAGVEPCYFGGTSLYRSTDGGHTWTGVLTNKNAWTPVTSIVFDHANGNIAFAATFYGGLYKSTDAGKTWNPANGTGNNAFPTANLGRMALAMAPSNPSILYAAIEDNSNSNLLGMYKSVDTGNNWTKLPNTPDFCSTQCWYDIVLAVSPKNPNFVVAGGVYPYHPGGSAVTTSADGGTTWVDQSNGLHPDTHALLFSPDGTTLYTGSDGGVWSTTNPTATNINWSDLNSSLAIAEFYPGLSMDQNNVNHSYAGTQDNSTQKFSGPLAWNEVDCGDGGATLMDYTNTRTVYTNCIGLSFDKSTDDGANWNSAQQGIDENDRTAWVPPVAIDPEHHNTLYFGTYRVYQTTDGAAQWNPISGDLTGTSGKSVLNAIAIAPTDANTIYTGSGDGRVHVTRNALSGASSKWTDVTSSSLPNRSVNWIAVDPAIATTAYVGFSGFTGYGDQLGHIFKTVNAGSTWTDISGDLPNTPVDAILVDPDLPETIFIGTDIGTFYTTAGGSSWSKLGTGLPNVVVTGLGLHESSRTLRATTHGRSVWDLNVASLLPIPTIATVSPSTVTADTSSAKLTVTGYQFTSKSIVTWNGSPLKTTYVSSSEVSAAVPASDLLKSESASVEVLNGTGGKLSNKATVTVVNPKPTLTALSKTSATTGSAGFTLTVTGTNFVPTSKIEWQGKPLTTTYKSATSLSAAIPASDLAKAATVSITVVNPAPGGGTSSSIAFKVN